MKILYDEILRRFPEIISKFSEGDEELPYLGMIYLADWLKEMPKDAITPQLVERLVSFMKWCWEQPPGNDASDDLCTIFTVGFTENLFESDTTRSLLPRLMSREEFVANADYFRSWVGVENYDQAAKYFESSDFSEGSSANEN